MATTKRTAAVVLAVVVFGAFHLWAAYVVLLVSLWASFCEFEDTSECDLAWTGVRIARWVLAAGAGVGVYALLAYAISYARRLRSAKPFAVALGVTLALLGLLVLHLRAYPL